MSSVGKYSCRYTQTIQTLNNRGIWFKSLQENIDTTTTGGKLIFHIFGALAEFERDLIRDRTNAGLKSARARGRLGGRPPSLDKRQIDRLIQLYDEGRSTVNEICKIFGISKSGFYNYVNNRKILASANESVG